MGREYLSLSIIISCLLVGACTSGGSGKRMDVAAPLPPLSDSTPVAFDYVMPAAGHRNAALNNNNAQKSCSFSSFHRKNLIGYELDDRRQIGVSFSPSMDVFDPSDAKVEVGLRFSMALGGPAKKRPDCTYGTGYYGLLPYATNEGVQLGGLTDMKTIKGFVQEKLDERERRAEEREARRQLLH